MNINDLEPLRHLCTQIPVPPRIHAYRCLPSVGFPALVHPRGAPFPDQTQTQKSRTPGIPGILLFTLCVRGGDSNRIDPTLKTASFGVLSVKSGSVGSRYSLLNRAMCPLRVHRS